MVHLFLILPESEPSNTWVLSNEEFQDPDSFNLFLKELEVKVRAIECEEFEGYYDLMNVQNFLRDFELMEDCYPKPALTVFRNMIRSLSDWREQIEQIHGKDYRVFNQAIFDHTFCEIFERKLKNGTGKFCVINHYGHNLGNEINVSVGGIRLTISSLSTEIDLIKWFSKERMPIRNFQIIPKHGENRQDERNINGELVSPLRCSQEEAQEMLCYAIGLSVKELYYFDRKHNNYIIFKHEGQTPQNMYHGYHVFSTTLEITDDIKDRLAWLLDNL